MGFSLEYGVVSTMSCKVAIEYEWGAPQMGGSTYADIVLFEQVVVELFECSGCRRVVPYLYELDSDLGGGIFLSADVRGRVEGHSCLDHTEILHRLEALCGVDYGVFGVVR